MKPSYKFYKGCYRIARATVGLFYRLRVTGKENIPEGAAMVCANHSSLADPFLMAFAFGIRYHMHFIAKVELFKIPVVSQLLKNMGMISVNRGMLDVATVKSTFGYLKKNDKIAIFPEGTRAAEDGEVSAKNGAVKLADHAGVPLVPVFIPRKKHFFSCVSLVIGEPYYIPKQAAKRSTEEYARFAEDLMGRISALDHTGAGGST